jgi:hypothetical protein
MRRAPYTSRAPLNMGRNVVDRSCDAADIALLQGSWWTKRDQRVLLEVPLGGICAQLISNANEYQTQRLRVYHIRKFSLNQTQVKYIIWPIPIV